MDKVKLEKNTSIPIEPLDKPVMPCALVMVTEPQPNGGVGHYFLVRDYNDKYYQTLRIQHRVRFVTNPTLLEKSGCKIILHKA